MRRTILILLALVLTTAAAWRHGDAYILHSGKTNVTMMSNMTIEKLVAAQKRFGENEPYFWMRIDGREYLISDEAFLREARELWAPINALKPEQKELDAEERRLDHRIDAIEDGKATASREELQQLRERIRVVERRQSELDQHEEAMEKVVEAKLRDMAEDAIRTGVARPMR
jgi:flagellar motility protein MotE (MotC chaperone)